MKGTNPPNTLRFTELPLKATLEWIRHQVTTVDQLLDLQRRRIAAGMVQLDGIPKIKES